MKHTLRSRMRGVTLLELMIVIVVLSLIVTVAIPNYREYAARAKRTEARAALLQIATNQERFYLQNNTYTTDMTELGFAATGCNTTQSGSYSVCVPTADANNFTATATYQNTDAEADKCKTWTINGAGVQSSSPYGGCWTATR